MSGPVLVSLKEKYGPGRLNTRRFGVSLTTPNQARASARKRRTREEKWQADLSEARQLGISVIKLQQRRLKESAEEMRKFKKGPVAVTRVREFVSHYSRW